MSLPLLLSLILGLALLALAGSILWRKVLKRYVSKKILRGIVWSWLGAGIAITVLLMCAVWDKFEIASWTSLIFIFLGAWAASIACFGLMTSRKLGFPLLASCICGNVNSVVSILLLGLYFVYHGPWYVFLLPAMALSTVVVIAVAYMVRASSTANAGETDALEGPGMEQDRDMVIKMLQGEKVSGEEAAELLKALGTHRAPADRVPMSSSVRGVIGGNILIVIGFMLPWTDVKLPSLLREWNVAGYQAGYSVGFLGWLILIMGVLPAIMICIPALEKHVRMGLLRMVLASIGGALVMTLLLGNPTGIGLWMVTTGFAFQLIMAFAQSGFASSRPQE